MEYFNIDVWRQVLSSTGIDFQYLIYGVILVTTMLVTFTAGVLFIGVRSPLEKRVRALSQNRQSNEHSVAEKFADRLESISPYLTKGDEKENESYTEKLMHAGFHHKKALSIFYSLKALSTVIGLGIAFLIYYFKLGAGYNHLLIMTAVFLGVFIPNFALRHLQKERQRKVRNGIPDALDLLVVCTESGLGFNAALRRVASELFVSHPELADELETVCAKIQAGVTMPDALSQLVVRTGLTELAGLVSVLTHAAKMGGSLAETLRSYTDDFRDKRQQAAEEVAAKIPTKMLFPMLLFIWPCFFIVALGPGILIVLDALSSPGASL